MRRAKRGIAALGALAFVAGCGRIAFTSDRVGTDGGDALGDSPNGLGFDPIGHWVAQRVHETGAGSRDRDDLVNGIRGDTWFAADGTYRARLLRLVASGPLDTSSLTGQIDSGDHQIVLHIDGQPQTGVYDVAVTDADHVTLTWKSSDPRNVSVPIDDVIELVRTPDLPAALVGSRAISRMAFAMIPEFAAGTCLDLTTESDRISGTSVLDENFLIVTTLLFQTYGPGLCPGLPTNETVVTNTFLDATETSFTMWNEVGGSKTRMRGDIVISATTIRLTRTECTLDQAECDSDVTVLEVPR